MTTPLTPTQLQALADLDYTDNTSWAVATVEARYPSLIRELAQQLLTTQQRLAEVEGQLAAMTDIAQDHGAKLERSMWLLRTVRDMLSRAGWSASDGGVIDLITTHLAIDGGGPPHA